MPTYERRNGSSSLLDLQKIRETLEKNRFLWIAPFAVFTTLGVLHALTKSNEWSASQALIVRDEAISEIGFGGGGPLGRFDSNDSLKRSLETILQIAKNRLVAGTALERVGPVKERKKPFPTEREIESFIKTISVSAPKGTEFGTTEVLYLTVDAKHPQRATRLASAVCDELELRLQELRNDHAQSVIVELTEKEKLAKSELQMATDELSALERELGEDLGEMRTLAESGASGSGNLRTQVNQIRGEIRQAETTLETRTELLALLTRIGDDIDAILATPNQILETQPALGRLKDGLVDAQLRTARLLGGLTEEHPRVRAAILNETNVRNQLLAEAKNAIAATQAEIAVSKRLVESGRGKLNVVQKRLDRLASLRAGYVNLNAKVSQRREQLRVARADLAEANGRKQAASASSLITRLDTPTVGSRPNGPSRKVIVAGSSLGGLLLGLTLVYLLAPWQESRRAGRRKTDMPGRRASDQLDGSDRRTPRQADSYVNDTSVMSVQSLSDAVTNMPASEPPNAGR